MNAINQLHKQLNKGFALLELILALAILAVILMLGLSYYTQKELNLKVNTAAVEMQTWLQAALFYYQRNGNWPVATKQKTVQQILVDDGYIANPALENPWGQPITVSTILKLNSNITDLTISTKIPPGYTNSNEIAYMIAGRLPSATPRYKDGATNTVTISMAPPPTYSTSKPNVMIMDISTINGTGEQVKVPDCPAGYTPELHVAMNQFFNKASPSVIKDITTKVPAPVNNIWHPTMIPHMGYPLKTGTAKMLEIASCEKDSSTNAAQQTTNNHYLF